MLSKPSRNSIGGKLTASSSALNLLNNKRTQEMMVPEETMTGTMIKKEILEKRNDLKTEEEMAMEKGDL